RCPYAMRARMALKYSGVKVEIREIILRDKPQAMLQASPKGTVPVLVLPQDEVIDESRDIMNWAIAINDPQAWQKGYSEAELNAINALIDKNDSSFKANLDRYKYPNRYGEATALDYRRKGEEFLQELEALLHSNQYLFADKISIADIAIFPFIRQFAHVDKEWFFNNDSYPKLQKWLNVLMESQLFSSIMTKYEVWKEGDEIVWF
ncbi:MAG: glutathione S-transferase, partial [Proteobacteria bacterium]|nr:glutathione S-transferase [Pseudomonadota bacterium]